MITFLLGHPVLLSLWMFICWNNFFFYMNIFHPYENTENADKNSTFSEFI